MKRQYLDTLFPFDRVDANHRGLAGKINGCNDCIQLGHIEIALEFFTLLGFVILFLWRSVSRGIAQPTARAPIHNGKYQT